MPQAACLCHRWPSVTGSCDHYYLHKYNHIDPWSLAASFEWEELFVFHRHLWLWPWPALRYLSTTNHQKPTPWPLENEFACHWASLSLLAQVKCQLDHWLNVVFVYLSTFSSQTCRFWLESFSNKTAHPNSQCAVCGHWNQPVHTDSLGRYRYRVVTQLSGKTDFVLLWTACI